MNQIFSNLDVYHDSESIQLLHSKKYSVSPTDKMLTREEGLFSSGLESALTL